MNHLPMFAKIPAQDETATFLMEATRNAYHRGIKDYREASAGPAGMEPCSATVGFLHYARDNRRDYEGVVITDTMIRCVRASYAAGREIAQATADALAGEVA